jgi:hypothetical protein
MGMELTGSLEITRVDPEMHGDAGEIPQQNDRHPAQVIAAGVSVLDLP